MSTFSNGSAVYKNNDINTQINNIFDDNELYDLKRFIHKRKVLNNSNSYLIYLFHILQSAGVFTTTIATGYNNTNYIWLGVGLNILASLINIFQQTNNNISKKLLQDIQSIKENKYTGECIQVDSDNNNNSSPPISREMIPPSLITNSSIPLPSNPTMYYSQNQLSIPLTPPVPPVTKDNNNIGENATVSITIEQLSTNV